MKLQTAIALLFCSAPALAKSPAPEDLLKGKIIISDHSLPSSWHSVSAYVSQLRKLEKNTLWYDKKTGKVEIHYAAFFAQPVNDVQVNLVVFDITGGAHDQRASTENFMNRGDRVLFNTITFDKEDIEGNKKYLLTIQHRHRILAAGQVTLRMEGPHYSGKVTFTDAETKESNKDSNARASHKH